MECVYGKQLVAMVSQNCIIIMINLMLTKPFYTYRRIFVSGNGKAKLWL
jgi:hypothetical protein